MVRRLARSCGACSQAYATPDARAHSARQNRMALAGRRSHCGLRCHKPISPAWLARIHNCRSRTGEGDLRSPRATTRTRSASMRDREGDKPGADSAPLQPPGDQGVVDECVGAAIPCDVDKCGQTTVLPRTYPTQAVPIQLCLPVVISTPVAKAFRVQRVRLGVGKRPAPPVGDHWVTVRTSRARVHVIFQQCWRAQADRGRARASLRSYRRNGSAPARSHAPRAAGPRRPRCTDAR